ncbi:MAG: HAMP domain-containing histidine kinase [Deltaproteobacteria bacterium]|nr:HAMP domain-containing histidine kinase [Deltaproteobacteria bacterium]
MELALFGVTSVLLLSLVLVLRDLAIIRALIMQGSLAKSPLTPIAKEICEAIKALVAVPRLLGPRHSSIISQSISPEVLNEVAREVSETIGLECLLCCFVSDIQFEYGSTSSKLSTAFLSFRDFLFDSEEDCIAFPYSGRTDSIAMFGILKAQGYNYIHIDKISKSPKIFVILVSSEPIETSAINKIITFLDKELVFRQQIFELSKDLKELQDKSVLMQRKILSVAHDFKGPIQTLNLLLSQFKSEEKQELLELGKISLQFLDEMVAKSVGELESPETPNPVALNLFSACQDVRSVLLPILKFKDRNLSIQMEEFNVICDPCDLKRILINLVSNSVKYSKSQVLTISACRDQKQCVLTLDDPEADIDEQTFALFDHRKLLEFNTSGTVFPGAHGWGRGLINVAVLCKRNNLDLQFDRSNGTGLKVKVVFPLVA